MLQDSGAQSIEAPAAADAAARYLPSAYLAPWAMHGALCAMRKVEGEVIVEAMPPDAADFAPQIQVHEDDDLSPELAQQLDRQLAALLIAEPAAALQPIIEQRAADWDGGCRESWARFLVSLILRHPSVVAQVRNALRDILKTGTRELQRRYAAKRSDPRTFAEYVTRANPQAPNLSASQYLQKIMDGDTIAATIGKMQWARITVSNARFTLLTSDQPLDIPLSLADKNAYIALPLRPAALFVASNNQGLIETLTRHDPSKVVRMMNLATVTRARDYVFGVDDSQFAFVKHHFGTTPVMPLISDRPLQEALATLKRQAAR